VTECGIKRNEAIRSVPPIGSSSFSAATDDDNSNGRPECVSEAAFPGWAALSMNTWLEDYEIVLKTVEMDVVELERVARQV